MNIWSLKNVAIYLIRKCAGAYLKDIGFLFGMNSCSSVGSFIMRIKLAMDQG